MRNNQACPHAAQSVEWMNERLPSFSDSHRILGATAVGRVARARTVCTTKAQRKQGAEYTVDDVMLCGDCPGTKGEAWAYPRGTDH